MIRKLSALPAACLAFLLLSSCEATPLQGGEEDGDVITFSAVTGYDSSSTKTAYSGETSGTPAKERIDWMAGDRFKLVCAQATPSSSDYEIDATGITAEGAKSHAAKIVPVPTGTFPNGTPKTSGLKWGTAWPHQFYAVYPSTAGLSTSGQISATVPAAQSPRATEPVTTTTSGGKTVARVHPDMNNCLMWSGTSVASKGKFTLRFTPMVTTFQFTVGGDGTGAGDITISSVELLSSNVALCGDLTAQVTGTGATAEIAQRGGSVSYTLPSSGTGSSVTFTLPANTKINDTQSLTFTLFVYPTGRTVNGQDILDGLTVKYNTSVGTRSLALKYSANAQTNPGAWVQFPAGRKINIENLQLPAQLEYWRYSITIGNHEEEISDVAVSPVQVEEWDEEEYPHVLDEMTPVFSVSPTKKVKFAPGNLRVNASTSPRQWAFEDNQWDIYETWDVSHISHFCFGTGDTPEKLMVSADYQTFTDWGRHFDDAGIGHPELLYSESNKVWYTLSIAEWAYLLGLKLEDYYGIAVDGERENCSQLWGLGSIYDPVKAKYVNGLIICPDNWATPSGCLFNPGDTSFMETNKYTAESSSNANCPGGLWSSMEAAGAVFLPATDTRHENSLIVSSMSNGEYWSSSPYAPVEYDACSFRFYTHGISLNPRDPAQIPPPEAIHYRRYNGICVRLVHDIVP